MRAAIILSLMFLVIVTLSEYQARQHAPEPYTARYTRGDCVRWDGDARPEQEIIIIMVDELYYTVLRFEHADRRYAGPKPGEQIPIRLVDMYAHKVTCPEGWV